MQHLSYLIADPAEIVAVDLNQAHVALTKLKLAAAQFLPSHGAFYRFFGEAKDPANTAAYHRFLRSRLGEVRSYWDGRDYRGRKRITLFERNIYAHGLLGYFIRVGHLVARAYGADPGRIISARTLDEQRQVFETELAPLFSKRLIRWATSQKASLFGLGIPPAQYERLAASGPGGMATVLKGRLERLACGFPVSENYFAWQAFGRAYPSGGAGPLPPYLLPRALRRNPQAGGAGRSREPVGHRLFGGSVAIER
jgi:S-adenosylmethionine-diacylglycerol 3-amino-3-carboxypropyl transferase